MDPIELEVLSDRAARQRRLADMLRKQALDTQFQENPGRMISGHYVAPSWAQGLNQVAAPIMNRQAATQAEQQAAAQELAASQAINSAKRQWQGSMPQAVLGTPEQTGPTDPNNPGELMAQPGQPVTTGQILKHTLAGAAIPGNEKMAALYNQSALGDLAREDQQSFRREEAAASRAAALQKGIADREAKLEELRVRLEDKALDRASREQMAAQQRALTAQIANGNMELRRLAIEAKQEADRNRSDDKKAAAAEKEKITTEGEKSSAGYLNRMTEAEKLIQQYETKGKQSLFTKTVGGLPLMGKDLQPYAMSNDQQKLLNAQRDWVRAKLRKESGAVIGPEEMAEEIRTYFPQPGEGKDIVDQKADARRQAQRQLEIGAGRELKNATPKGANPGIKVYNPATGQLE
jgi:hypothetical protein